MTSSAGVIFSSRRFSRLSMADMRLFSSFIWVEEETCELRRIYICRMDHQYSFHSLEIHHIQHHDSFLCLVFNLMFV